MINDKTMLPRDLHEQVFSYLTPVQDDPRICRAVTHEAKTCGKQLYGSFTYNRKPYSCVKYCASHNLATLLNGTFTYLTKALRRHTVMLQNEGLPLAGFEGVRDLSGFEYEAYDCHTQKILLGKIARDGTATGIFATLPSDASFTDIAQATQGLPLVLQVKFIFATAVHRLPLLMRKFDDTLETMIIGLNRGPRTQVVHELNALAQQLQVRPGRSRKFMGVLIPFLPLQNLSFVDPIEMVWRDPDETMNPDGFEAFPVLFTTFRLILPINCS